MRFPVTAEPQRRGTVHNAMASVNNGSWSQAEAKFAGHGTDLPSLCREQQIRGRGALNTETTIVRKGTLTVSHWIFLLRTPGSRYPRRTHKC